MVFSCGIYFVVVFFLRKSASGFFTRKIVCVSEIGLFVSDIHVFVWDVGVFVGEIRVFGREIGGFAWVIFASIAAPINAKY